MSQGGVVDPGTGFSLPAFDPELSGDVTVWLNQGAGPGTPTLRFVVSEPAAVGSASFSVTLGSNDIDISNFGNNSFLVTNTGEKKISKIEIDVTNALYPDTVFDPFGVAGDTVSKLLTISGGSNTGVIAPDHGSAGSPGTTYIGTGGIDGFETIQILFDENVDGGFENGETVGFAVDMDPNSIAGCHQEHPRQRRRCVGWHPAQLGYWRCLRGGIDRLDLHDHLRGRHHGDPASFRAPGTRSARSATPRRTRPILRWTSPPTASRKVKSASYSDGGPTIIVNGPAGETARIVVTKGFVQPGENNFTDAYAAQLEAQLERRRRKRLPGQQTPWNSSSSISFSPAATRMSARPSTSRSF